MLIKNESTGLLSDISLTYVQSQGQMITNEYQTKGQDNRKVIESHGDKVAKHYNKLVEVTPEKRRESRIYHMRNFNNWIKRISIEDTIKRVKQQKSEGEGITVLDLCSGKGKDLPKWRKGGLKKLICADIAEKCVLRTEQKWKELMAEEKNKTRLFDAEFIAADLSKKRLKDLYKDPDTKVDICSCQFAFHYSFEGLSQAEMMLRNAVECLNLGGYFIGTTTDSNELVKRLRESPDMSFGNDVYKVTFETEDKENLPLFGARFNFQLDGVVDCQEFLVYFPLLEMMAEKYGMKLVMKMPFAEFYKEAVKDAKNRKLLSKMDALERFPPSANGRLCGSIDKDYDHAKDILGRLKANEFGNCSILNSEKTVSVGTLSKAEWEAITVYCVFMFQKVWDPVTGEVWEENESDDEGININFSNLDLTSENESNIPVRLLKENEH